MTTSIAITIMLVVPILGTGGSISLPPTCALFILADNTQNVKILIIQKRNGEILQKRKKKKTVERGRRTLAQYNYGVSSSSQIIFLLLNLLCLHTKLANCDVGGFCFFFSLNATGGVAVLGKVMVNLYLWGEGGEEMGAGDVVQKRSTTQYFQGENKLERKQITLCLVCHHGFLCHTEGV